MFVRPKKLIRTSGTEALGYVDIRTLAEGMCRYDLNEQDVAWLQMANEQFAEMGESRAGWEELWRFSGLWRSTHARGVLLFQLCLLWMRSPWKE